MIPDSPADDTQSLRPDSDPREVARRHAERNRGDQPPELIGPYRILETLGEGGMGTVYLAEQTKPIHRRVALKIIKLGMDTKSVIARFETEREALALMNHPNVARVFDAGTSEQGRPYFVMEHVAGIPITEYCDKHRLSTEDRLKLFADVCAAVQHAHQKGIIHRDLKPSNVLVTEIDGKASAKVIDFGIAKATQQKLSEHTYFTQQGQLIGTPAYMSPEQAGAVPAGAAYADIDTRTDVYSLGVILYELLVGALPFDPQSLRSAGFSGMQRIVREVDPPKPSTRLAGMGASSTTVADLRQTSLHTLARKLRGDLDWVVMKCLEKDRARRYDTVSDLIAEVQRYLRNEPVVAGPPSASYRMKKFVRRNKLPVVAVAGIVLALTAGLVVSDLQRRRAVRAEELAAIRLTDSETARDEAIKARDESDTVTQFLSDTLASVDPGKEGKDVTVREVFDKSAETIGEKFHDKPLIEARLRHTIGWTYRGLGLFEPAQAHLAEAAAIYTRELGPRDRRTLGATGAHAAVVGDQGHFSQAEAAQRSTLEIHRRVLGEEHPETLASMNNLAISLSNQGRYADAEMLHRQTLEIRRRVLGEEHPSTLRSMNSLASSLLDQGRYAEAEEVRRRALEIGRRVLGEEHLDTLAFMSSLASSLHAQGRNAEAEELRRQTLEIQRRVLGEEHPNTLRSMNNLAISIFNQGRYAEAEELYRQTLEIQRRVLGEEHPDTLTSINNVAGIFDAQGRHAEAETLHRQTLEIQRRVLGEEHPETLTSMHNLANSLNNQGRYAEAETLCRQTLEIQRRVLGEEHPDVAWSLFGLASVLKETQRWEEAEPLCRQAESIWAASLPAEHSNRRANANLLGRILTGLRRFAEAEPLLIESYEALQSDASLSASDRKAMLDRLVRLYESWDAAEPGKVHAEKAAQWRATLEKFNRAEEDKKRQAAQPNQIDARPTPPAEAAPPQATPGAATPPATVPSP